MYIIERETKSASSFLRVKNSFFFSKKKRRRKKEWTVQQVARLKFERDDRVQILNRGNSFFPRNEITVTNDHSYYIMYNYIIIYYIYIIITIK